MSTLVCVSLAINISDLSSVRLTYIRANTTFGYPNNTNTSQRAHSLYIRLDRYRIYFHRYIFLFIIIDFNDVCLPYTSVLRDSNWDSCYFTSSALTSTLFRDEMTVKLLRSTFCMILRVSGFPTHNNRMLVQILITHS